MVGGFNTDVRHQGRVFHVQTEVTSRPHRQISTLLFEGGTILHTHRVAVSGKEEGEALQARMETQHRQFIDSLKGGSFDGQLGLERTDTDRRASARNGSIREFGEGVIGTGRLDEIVLAHLGAR